MVSASRLSLEDHFPVVADHLRHSRHSGVARDEHSTFTRRDVLVLRKGENPTVAYRPDQTAVVAGARRLGAVLDQTEPVPSGDTGDVVKVRRMAEQVDH